MSFLPGKEGAQAMHVCRDLGSLNVCRAQTQNRSRVSPCILTCLLLRSATAMPRKSPKRSAKARSSVCKAEKKLGPADALHGAAFASWLSHLQSSGPTWLFIVVSLQHVLCCRVTEILRIQLQDCDLAGKRMFIKPMKKGAGLWKPLSEAALLLLTRWQEEGGVSVNRTKVCGSRGLQTHRDEWAWPLHPEDYFFPAGRKGAQCKHRNKDMCHDPGKPPY